MTIKEQNIEIKIDRSKWRIVESGAKQTIHKCTCNIHDLMNYGCKCGGI